MAFKIFISYKNSFGGVPTKDGAIAEHLYRYLSENGYKGEVFFSEREIYNKGCSEFPQVITNAIDQAKVLIYVCSDARYFDESNPETEYVNSEWKSFKNEMYSGRKRGAGIYGVLDGAEVKDLPLGLRIHQAFDYKSELPKLLSALNAMFEDKAIANENGDPDERLKKYIDLQFKKFAHMQEDNFVRSQFNDYLQLQFNAKTNVALVYYQPACGYSSALFSALNVLDTAGDNILFLNDYNDFAYAEQLVDFSQLKEEYFFVIAKIGDLQEGKQIAALAETYENIRVLISVTADRTDIYESLKKRAVVYKFGPLSGKETREYVNLVSGELAISITGNLLTTLLLPSLKELRTPQILRGILVELSHLPDFKEKNYTIFDILRSIDEIIANADDACSLCVEQLITFALQRKINRFSLIETAEFKEEVEKLIKLGVLRRHRNGYIFVSDDYFYYKIAGIYFENAGKNYKTEWFEAIGDSVPYFVYMFYEETGEYIGDKFEMSDERIYRLLQLFVNREEIISLFVRNGNYRQGMLALVKFFRKSGLYVTAKKLIAQFRENGVESCDGFDYVSEEIMIYFHETGKLLNTEQTHGDIYFKKAYIYYCIDDIENTNKFFKLAYKKMLDEGSFNEGLLFDYTEYLLDVEDYEKLKEVTAILERHLNYDNSDYMMRYCFLKGSIAVNNLEFSLAKDFFEKSIEYCNQDVKLKKLQIYYGGLGEVYFYLNDLASAKKFYETNLYIARLINDSNGQCISLKMLGRTELLSGNFLKAFKYFGYAKIYAEKADNKWRLGKVLLSMNLLMKGGFKGIKYIELPASNVYQLDFYFLRSLICYVCGDMNGARQWLEKAIPLIETVNCKYLCEKVRAWARYLDGGDIVIHKDLQNYFKTLINAVERLKAEDTAIDGEMNYYLYRELDTERLYLRHLCLDDAESIYEYSSDIFNTKYIMWQIHDSVSDAYDYIDSMFDIDSAGKSFTWAIEERANNKMIGTIDLVYNEKFEEFEVGYILNKQYWGKGYAAEALNAAIDFAKNVLKLKKLIGITFNVNEKSKNVLIKCGFKFVRAIENYHTRADVSDKSGAFYELDLT